MLERKPNDEGFGLVEVVIAFFLLAIIAVAILPALVNGIRFSSEQSSTATATRYINKVIEDARVTPNCATLDSLTSPTSTRDGRGANITVSGTVSYAVKGDAASPSPACAAGADLVATVTLTATQNSESLATVSARIFVP